MRRIFFSCLILFAFLLVSCNQVVELPTAAKEISIDAVQISDSSGWMSINHDTKITITNVADDEVFVMYIKDYSDASNSSRSVSSSMIGGLNKTQTGKQIIRTKDGVASFSGSDAGVSEDTTFKIEKLKVKKVETLEDFRNIDFGVFDYNGKDKGKVYIPNSKYHNYYIDELVLSINVNQILNQLKKMPNFDNNMEKVVLTRSFRYYDAEKAENKVEAVIHNTRNTYGFLVKENGEYKVVSEGVFNLNEIGNRVNLYAGFASTEIMGSGMTIKVLPVTVMAVNDEVNVTTKDAVFGFEDLEKGEYALCIKNLGSNSIGDFSLQDNSTEIKKFDGSSLPNGLMLSYYDDLNSYYYYLGELSGDVYINNTARNESIKPDASGVYYTAELIKYDEVPKSIRNISTHTYKDNIAIGVIKTKTSAIIEEDMISEIFETNGSHVTNGNISFVMTDVPSGKKCKVEFKKYIDGEWKTVYDSAKYSCIIGNTSTGNKLLEFDLNPTNGKCNVSFRFNNLEEDESIIALVSFDG